MAFERLLADYHVPKSARLLAHVSGNGHWYYNGRRVANCDAQYFRDECTRSLLVSLHLVTDDGVSHHVSSTDSELPTTNVPRSYRKRINQQLLEDINYG